MSLCVDIIPSSCCDVLKVSDGSTFTTEVVTDISLSITSPGFTVPVVFSGLSLAFINNYNSVDLGLSAEPGVIPDGVYTIVLTATVDGEVQTYTKEHLKVCTALSCYYELLCKVKVELCEPSGDKNRKLQDLAYIKLFIDAAVSKVEYCDAVEQGTQMLDYANSLLKKYKTGNCITC